MPTTVCPPSRVQVGPDVLLHAKVPPGALLCLMHVRFARPVLFLGRRRSPDQRGVDQRCRAQRPALQGQVRVDGLIKITPVGPCASGRRRNLSSGVAPGAASRARSTPTNRPTARLSYSGSSMPSLDNQKHCCAAYIRSIRSTPTSARPAPRPRGWSGSIVASAAHGVSASSYVSNRSSCVNFLMAAPSRPETIACIAQAPANPDQAPIHSKVFTRRSRGEKSPFH